MLSLFSYDTTISNQLSIDHCYQVRSYWRVNNCVFFLALETSETFLPKNVNFYDLPGCWNWISLTSKVFFMNVPVHTSLLMDNFVLIVKYFAEHVVDCSKRGLTRKKNKKTTISHLSNFPLCSSQPKPMWAVFANKCIFVWLPFFEFDVLRNCLSNSFDQAFFETFRTFWMSIINIAFCALPQQSKGRRC